MADWTGMTRSSYARMKDRASFIRFLDLFFGDARLAEKDDGTLGFYSLSGDMPTLFPEEMDENDLAWISRLSGTSEEDWDEFVEICDLIHLFLADGEVIVITQAGHEKSRYVSGCAIAVRSDGEGCAINLHDIFMMVKDDLGKDIPFTHREF